MFFKSLFIRPLFIEYPQVSGNTSYKVVIGNTSRWIAEPRHRLLFTFTSEGVIFNLFRKCEVCDISKHFKGLDGLKAL